MKLSMGVCMLFILVQIECFHQEDSYIVIDTDAGTDDAWAIFIALAAHRDPSINIRLVGITCVHGNTDVDGVGMNVRRALNAANVSDVPVYRGSKSALLPAGAHLSSRTQQLPHPDGTDGFGDAGLGPIDVRFELEHAVSALTRLSREYEGKLKILAIGPLTNIALAVKLDPSITARIKELQIMGGNIEGEGNASILGEFNFHSDPEAAYIVLSEYSCNIILIPWEVPKRTELKEFRTQILAKLASSQVELMNKAERRALQRDSRWSPADALAAAVLVEPRVIVEYRKLYATVELVGSFARGLMVLDRENRLNLQANAAIVYKIDIELYKRVLQWAVLERAGQANGLHAGLKLSTN